MHRDMAIASLQGTALSALSNIVAQVIDCIRKGLPLSFHATQLLRFVAVMALLQPILFYWQCWLEHTWPGHKEPKSGPMYAPIPIEPIELEDIQSSSLDGGNVREAESQGHGGKRRRRVWRNVWMKWTMDNTLGGLWYTVLFIVLVELFKWRSVSEIWAAVLKVSYSCTEGPVWRLTVCRTHFLS